jgi:predicted  nucleic acid-binding Zn-ribbon protein
MALLSAKAGNPLDELVAAIDKVVADIDTKLEEENGAFETRTGEHNAEIKRLNREIDSANADIARTETFLREVLYVMKATLERDISDLAAEIEKTKKFLEEAAIQREAEHNDYLAKLSDAEGGIEAINEAWELLGSLLEGGAPSLI